MVAPQHRLRALLRELRRRRVIRVAVGYAVIAWVVVQVVATTFPVLELPNWVTRLIVVLAILGFPVTVALAWVFDITPAGVERTAGRLRGDNATLLEPLRSSQLRIGRVLVGSFVLAGAAIAAASLMKGASQSALDPMVIAVLPFRVTAPDSAYNYLREGGVDLLNAHLTGDELPRAVDSRTMLNRWRRAVAGEAGEVTMTQALELAAAVGAGRLFMGELLVTRSRMTLSGRLLRVPDGTVEAEHTQSTRIGETDEIAAIEKVLGRLLATIAGERTPRLSQLSDSMTAVKAYLAGRQAHRRGQHAQAVAHYDQALAIDSTFALAAYFRAQVSYWVPSIPLALDARKKLWALRDRLSTADSAQLVAQFGPNYPEPSTWFAWIEAAERAARLNPDRPDAFETLGSFLVVFGRQAGIRDWLPRGIVALDSAIALDSTVADPTAMRLYAALLRRNASDIRRSASLYFSNSPAGDLSEVNRWLVAYVLGDEAVLAEMRLRLDRLAAGSLAPLVDLSILLGLPLDDVDRALTARFRGPAAAQDACDLLRPLFRVAAVRGQMARAVDVAESAMTPPGCASGNLVVALSLVEPGFAAAADALVRDHARASERAANATTVCYTELWRVVSGDTSRTRAAIDRITQMVRDLDPLPLPRAGRLGLCARLLEATAESWSGSQAAPALARLEQLHRLGTGWESPAGAHLMLARLLEKRRDVVGALAALRRRPNGWNPWFTVTLPATLREEGRLAALVGDTAAAMRAYHHYLTLRDQPDAGAMDAEVQRARADLAALESKSRKR